MSSEKKNKPLRLGGGGKFYDDRFVETQITRDARWHYFTAICRNNLLILERLTNEIYPTYIKFLDLVDCEGIENSCFRIYTVTGENRSHLLTVNGPQLAVSHPFIELKIDEKEFVNRLTRFQVLLNDWYLSTSLNKCGPWIWDIVLNLLWAWGFKGPGTIDPTISRQNGMANALISPIEGQPKLVFETFTASQALSLVVEAAKSGVLKDRDTLYSIDAIYGRRHYNPLASRKEEKKRLMKAFSIALEEYMDETEMYFEEKGFPKAKQLRAKRKDTTIEMRFDWLYLRHFEGKKYSEIAVKYIDNGFVDNQLNESQIQQHVQELAALCEIIC